MTDPLEDLLARQPEAEPSPRFAARTMTAVRAEADARLGLPFPIRRLALGAASIAAAGLAATVPDVAEVLQRAWHWAAATGAGPALATLMGTVLVLRASHEYLRGAASS